MRIFVALDIDDAIREHIQRFLEGVREFAPDARWVRPESLHVTLKFIGERPSPAVEEIKSALTSIEEKSFDLAFRGWGYFPTMKAARVFWIGIYSGPQLGALAQTIDDATAAVDVPKETHPYSPHLTLARGAIKPFQRLQEKLAAVPAPNFGTMTAREFFLYQSELGRGGSRYTKIARFMLK